MVISVPLVALVVALIKLFKLKNMFKTPLVNVVGIGAQKCASSWIYELLRLHDDVCVSEIKELNFFSYFYDHGFEWYESNFSNPKALNIEISPSYFYNTDTPQRVAQYNPNAKIILSLRDPIKRMFSNHLHEVRQGHITEKNYKFETAFNNNPLYLEQSLYSKHLKNWLSAFERNQIHIVFQEDVKRFESSVREKLFEFLDLQYGVDTKVLPVNASVVDRNKTVGTLLNIGGNAMRALNLEESLVKLKEQGPLSVIYKNNKLKVSEQVSKITPEFEDKLKKRLKPYNDELKELLDLENLPWEA
ncbi:hypothetical protein MTsDn5_03900 [Alteromonas gracilis]